MKTKTCTILPYLPDCLHELLINLFIYLLDSQDLIVILISGCYAFYCALVKRIWGYINMASIG